MRIRKEHTAGLVIDIQERLLPAMHNKDKLLRNSSVLIRGLQVLSLPVLVTQQYTRGLGETAPEIKSLFNEFQHIEKRDFSCCGSAEFMATLDHMGVKNVIICGIESHVCVLQTAVDLKESGFTPVIVMDATTSRFPENYLLAMERFTHEQIMITSVESILFELTESSAAGGFRDISALVK